jgi:hypothetical protein
MKMMIFIKLKMKENKEENENLITNQNKYICNICNSNDRYFLCDICFKKYNSTYEQKKNDLEYSEKLISKKIKDLLLFNNDKSIKLNKKLFYDKYKQVLLERTKQEENNIKKYEDEYKNYEKLIIEQKDKNSRLKAMLDTDNKEQKKEENIFDSTNNLMNSDIIVNENDDIDKIKNDIFEINYKITNYKTKYIYHLFDESFIQNKTLIKITDFFNVLPKKEENTNINRLNFSILNTQDNIITNELNIEALKKTEDKVYDIYLKRFNTFFISLVSFLEKAYKKFKLEMPYKISYPKIFNTNGFDYKFELKKEELDEEIAVNNAVKGYHLLNINYEYLINYIFGDSKKLKYLFDMSFFLTDKNENLGSLENIKEESKIKQKPEEIFGFEVVD